MKSIVVMGVAGCGKSSLGAALAARLGWRLIEGDEFHPVANVEKMGKGTPLTDADRAGWLDTLGAELGRHTNGAVLTCSALKRAYRDRLREAMPGLVFIHLTLGRDEALRRVAQRGGGHYFKASLVDSQFETLEDPANEPGVLSLDATVDIDLLTTRACAWLSEQPS